MPNADPLAQQSLALFSKRPGLGYALICAVVVLVLISVIGTLWVASNLASQVMEQGVYHEERWGVYPKERLEPTVQSLPQEQNLQVLDLNTEEEHKTEQQQREAPAKDIILTDTMGNIYLLRAGNNEILPLQVLQQRNQRREEVQF